MTATYFLDIVSKSLAKSTGAILGVTTRVFFNLLFSSRGADVTSSSSPVFVDLPANVLGCFVLGCFTSIKNRFAISQHITIATSVGYAGCLTTFASWNYQITQMFVRGDWVAAFFGLFFGMALPYTSFIVGRDFADHLIQFCNKYYSALNTTGNEVQNNDDQATTATLNIVSTQPDPYGLDIDPEVDPEDSKASEHSNTASPRISLEQPATIRESLQKIAITFPLFAIVFGGVLIAALRDEQYQAEWASAALAPLGSSIRWYLSRLNRNAGFPFGTFSANVAATIYDSCIGAILLHREVSSESKIVFRALITGFAGSLSTVSTWVNEASSASLGKRYIYLLSTVVVAQVFGISIYGGAYWASLKNS